MHTYRSTAVTLLLAGAVVAPAAGCRFVNRRGPVPPAVADARRLCNEGLSAADRQDLVRAEGLLERAVESCPVDVDARRHYADVLWQRNERMEAVAQITEAIKLSPADASLSIEAGRMYLELGLFTDADRLSGEAVRLAPRSADAWHLRGRLSMARGQPEAALADFHRALAIEPDDRESLRDAADAYLRIGRPRRALSTLAILGETYGPDQVPANVLVLEGAAHEALGRTDEAVAAYRLAASRGDAPAEAAARLVALEGRPPAAVAAEPAASALR